MGGEISVSYDAGSTTCMHFLHSQQDVTPYDVIVTTLPIHWMIYGRTKWLSDPAEAFTICDEDGILATA